jgi:hypothetical protein
MFLILLGASLTFGAGLLATAIYTEGALLALRTASEYIGWLFILATLAGLMSLPRASFGAICAASVTLCSGLAVLYMSYFFEWSERPFPAIRHAMAAETFSLRPVAYQVIEPVKRHEAPVLEPAKEAAKSPAPRRKILASAQPVSLAAGACSTFTGVESLQCNRCAEKLGLSWVMCQESVRLEYCASEAGDERTCPSPIPHSHPG